MDSEEQQPQAPQNALKISSRQSLRPWTHSRKESRQTMPQSQFCGRVDLFCGTLSGVPFHVFSDGVGSDKKGSRLKRLPFDEQVIVAVKVLLKSFLLRLLGSFGYLNFCLFVGNRSSRGHRRHLGCVGEQVRHSRHFQTLRFLRENEPAVIRVEVDLNPVT